MDIAFESAKNSPSNCSEGIPEAKKAAYEFSYNASKNGYAVVKSVSKGGIMGEYKFEKLLVDSDGGHSMSFLDLNGKRNLTFHQPNRPSEERMQLFLLD